MTDSLGTTSTATVLFYISVRKSTAGDEARPVPGSASLPGPLYSRPAPDLEAQSRAKATMTACGPVPATGATSTVVPSAESVPAQDPSGWRVRDTCVPAGRLLSASPFFGRALAARCCSSTSLAA